MKYFLKNTLGTKLFLYTASLSMLIGWFVYFRILNFQYWLSSDGNILISVIILLFGEGIALSLYELFRDKRKLTVRERTITKFNIDDELKDKDKNIGDYMHDWANEEEKNAENEYFTKQYGK